MKLNKQEQEIENEVESYQPVSSEKRKKIEKIIQKAGDRKNISLRVNTQDLDRLKLRMKED